MIRSNLTREGVMGAGVAISWMMAFLLGLVPTTAQAATGLFISEVMWDGVEYVELYNAQATSQSLRGWSLERHQPDGDIVSVATFTEEDVVEAQGYWLLEKQEVASEAPAQRIVTGLTLLNSGEQLVLRNDQGEVVDRANQVGIWFAGENTATGVAMERSEFPSDGQLLASWHTATAIQSGRQGTPGTSNSEPKRNTEPAVVIVSPSEGDVGEVLSFSAEDTTDADGDALQYRWWFGDGEQATGVQVMHAYGRAGTYAGQLHVDDGTAEVEVSFAVVVTQPVYTDAVVISEVLANPAGSDAAGEFIELVNRGSSLIDLAGWQVDDAVGGSTPYTLPEDTLLAGGAYLLLSRAETGIALNNAGDTVRLLDPTGAEKHLFTYTSSEEAVSYVQANDQWVLTTTMTPGEENQVTLSPADVDTDEEEETEATDEPGEVAGAQVAVVPLAQLRQQVVGTEVTTRGVVSVPPGVLGERIFYLLDSSGVQVYFSKGEFPGLRLGDEVAVTGELRESGDELRILLSSAEGVVVESAGEPPQPVRVQTGAVTEDQEGTLIVTQGTVTETSGDTFYLDDGSGPVRVYIKSTTEIDKPAMKKGVAVTVTGIVSETRSGYRVLPRFQEDVRLGMVAGLSTFPVTGRQWGGSLLVMSVALLAWGRVYREPLLDWRFLRGILPAA